MTILKQKNNKIYKNFIQNCTKQKGGFTIVETIVAIFIFSVSLVAIMTVFSSGIGYTMHARDKIIASYLAQEGIEQVRNLRDNYVNFTAVDGNNEWINFIAKLTAGGCDGASGCYFFQNGDFDFLGTEKEMINHLDITACGNPCAELYYNSTNGKYDYSATGNSGFRRKINVTFDTNIIKIISTVSFANRNTSENISFSEYLFNLTQ